MQITGSVTLNTWELDKVIVAIEYIDRHYNTPISANQLSEEFSLRTEKVQCGFRLLTGLSVHQYLIKVRIEKSKEDLEDFSLSVKQIARRNGFSSPSIFILHFKTMNSQTPGEFREQWLVSVPKI